MDHSVVCPSASSHIFQSISNAHNDVQSTLGDPLTVKTEKIQQESRLLPINSTSKSLPKVSAVFSPDDLRQKMTPILQRLYHHEDGGWFREPVTEAIAPGYFSVIKCPMDFSTIFKKLEDNRYQTPFQFSEDVWLVFNNTWTFNKKSHRVYKAALKVKIVFR
jgi:hypothetical protein